MTIYSKESAEPQDTFEKNATRYIKSWLVGFDFSLQETMGLGWSRDDGTFSLCLDGEVQM